MSTSRALTSHKNTLAHCGGLRQQSPPPTIAAACQNRDLFFPYRRLRAAERIGLPLYYYCDSYWPRARARKHFHDDFYRFLFWGSTFEKPCHANLLLCCKRGKFGAGRRSILREKRFFFSLGDGGLFLKALVVLPLPGRLPKLKGISARSSSDLPTLYSRTHFESLFSRQLSSSESLP